MDLADTSSIVQDVTVGTTRYVTVRSEYIPLLMPLKLLGVPKHVLDAMEPGLRAQIEKAYDRSAGPGAPVPARLGPGQSPQGVVDEYTSTIGQARQAVQAASPRRATTSTTTPPSATTTRTPGTSTTSTSVTTSTTRSTAQTTSTPSATTPTGTSSSTPTIASAN